MDPEQLHGMDAACLGLIRCPVKRCLVLSPHLIPSRLDLFHSSTLLMIYLAVSVMHMFDKEE